MVYQTEPYLLLPEVSTFCTHLLHFSSPVQKYIAQGAIVVPQMLVSVFAWVSYLELYVKVVLCDGQGTVR